MGAERLRYRVDFRNFVDVVIAVAILIFATASGLAPLQLVATGFAQDVSGEQIPSSPGPTTARLPEVTRVVITTSGPVMYEHYQKVDPPRIVIQFSSRNLISQMDEKVEVNRGVVREIQCRYYPGVARGEVGEEGRPLKSLVILLTQPTTYQIVEREKVIIIAIESPPGFLVEEFGLGEIEIAHITPDEEREVIGEELMGEEDRDEALISALSQAQAKLTGEEVPPEELKEVRAPILVEEEIPPPVVAAEVAPRVIKEEPIEKVKEIARPKVWYETKAFYIGDLSLVGLLGGLLLWLKVRRASIRRKKAKLEEGRPGDLAELERLNRVSPAIFDRLVVKVFERRGYKVLSAREVEGKGLVSMLVKEGEKVLLQYKRKEGFVGHFFVQDFYQSMAKVKADRGYLATTGSFTHPAKREAVDKAVELIDRDELFRLVSTYLKEAEEEEHIAREVSRREELQRELAAKEEMMKGKLAEKEKVIEEERTAKEKLLSDLEKDRAKIKELTKKEEARREIEQRGYPSRERRRYPRLGIDLAEEKVGLVVESESEPPQEISSRLKNISAGGFLLEKGEEVMVPERLRLKLELPDQALPIEISGERVWQKKTLSGISFSSLADFDRAKINRFIKSKSKSIRTKEKKESETEKKDYEIPIRGKRRKVSYYPLRGRSIWT